MVKHLSSKGSGIKVKVPKDKLEDPVKAGFRRSIGLHLRCRHYRRTLPDGRCVHVEETRDHYVVHIDETDPAVSAVGHLRKDAPGLWTAMCAGMGFAAGLMAGDKERRGAMGLAGALAGLIIGLLTGRWGRK